MFEDDDLMPIDLCFWLKMLISSVDGIFLPRTVAMRVQHFFMYFILIQAHEIQHHLY